MRQHVVEDIVNMVIREDWDQVLEVSSRHILNGQPLKKELFLYRAWLEALKARTNFDGLQSLGLHLLKRRSEHSAYLALAAFCMVYSGRSFYTKIMIRHIHKTARDSFSAEAVGVYCSERLSKKIRNLGTQRLARLAKKYKNVFLNLNFLNYALENDDFQMAAAAYKVLHKNYPRHPAPAMVAAQISMDNGQWADADQILTRIINNNSQHREARILSAICLDALDQTVKAVELMQPLDWSSEDAQTHSLLGHFLKKCYLQTKEHKYLEAAEYQYRNALRISTKIKNVDFNIFMELKNCSAQLEKPRLAPIAKKTLLSQKAWMLSVQNEILKDFLPHSEYLVRSPHGLFVGDYVFLAERKEVNGAFCDSVVRIYSVISEPHMDSKLGKAVLLKLEVDLAEKIELFSRRGFETVTDVVGAVNYSNVGYAKFMKLDKDALEEVALQLENKEIYLLNKVKERHENAS